MLRDDREWAVCFNCPRKHGANVRHPLRGNNADHDYQDFAVRHPMEQGHVVVRVGPDYMERAVRRAERRRKLRHDSILNFVDNASVLEAFQSSDQSMTLTTWFNSLASSATAGGSSAYIDNSSNLYLDLMTYVKIAAVNTAPANNKAFYIWAASMLLTSAAPTDLPSTGAASGGTVANSSSTPAALTFPSVATPLPCTLGQPVRVIPYPVQNAVNTTPLFGVAKASDGNLGLFQWLALLNYSGMTIASSGNLVAYRGIYNTVA